MSKKIKIILALIVPVIVLLVVGMMVANAQPLSHYDSSLTFEGGTFSYPPYTPAFMEFVWRGIDGWQEDRTGNCWASLRVNINTYLCFSSSYTGADGYKHYRVTLPMYLCGQYEVSLQPFLSIYNPTTSVHDLIWGDTWINSFFYNLCRANKLPLILKNSVDPTPYP